MHGDWHSFAAQKVYIKSDAESLFSVSKAAMRLPKASTPAGRLDEEPTGIPPDAEIQVEENVRTAGEPTGDPQLLAEEWDLPPEVVGVPHGAFQWS